MTDRKKLYLIDGPNMAFRAFFAIGGMTNSAGLPTNALFGFTNMLLKLIRDERPDYLAITWDPKGGSFRERDFPEYKGTRPDMPEAQAVSSDAGSSRDNRGKTGHSLTGRRRAGGRRDNRVKRGRVMVWSSGATKPPWHRGQAKR